MNAASRASWRLFLGGRKLFLHLARDTGGRCPGLGCGAADGGQVPFLEADGRGLHVLQHLGGRARVLLDELQGLVGRLGLLVGAEQAEELRPRLGRHCGRADGGRLGSSRACTPMPRRASSCSMSFFAVPKSWGGTRKASASAVRV